MPSLHGTNTINVEASIHRYYEDNLALIPRPSQLPSYTIVANDPETAIVTPSFSFHHIPAGTRYVYEGNRVSATEKGARTLAIFEISCWASRANVNWAMQLKTMTAMVEAVTLDANDGIAIRDYLSAPSNPVTLPYVIRILELEWVQTAPDPNPDLERRRGLINYHWIQRITA